MSVPPRLTPRQHQVLLLILDGRATKQIARELSIRQRTAEGHRQAVLRRTRSHGTVALVRQAIRWGWITP